MIKTNKDQLIKMAALGEIIDPLCLGYRSTWDGRTKLLVGMSGINFSVKVGDPCYGWATADHVEPGVTIQGKDNASTATALANLACIGNEATAVSGDAKGAKGVYTGRHAGAHDFCWFRDEDLQKLTIGDKVQVKTWGVGLKLEGFEDVRTSKLSPNLVEKMNIRVQDGKLEIPVAMEVPGYIMGSGIGFEPITEPVDYDIQTTCPKVVEELGLTKLRLGDIVALKDQACIYGRGHYRGAMTIGVVAHGYSDAAGHGPGVNPILSSIDNKISARIDPNANISFYLGLRKGM